MSQKEGEGMLEALIPWISFLSSMNSKQTGLGGGVPEGKEPGKAFLTKEKPFLA